MTDQQSGDYTSLQDALAEGDRPLADWNDLVLALGGDTTSFTGRLLELVAKADPENRHRLRIAYPREVRAWELWIEHAPDIKAGQLEHLLDSCGVTAAFVSVGQQFEQLEAFRRGVLGG